MDSVYIHLSVFYTSHVSKHKIIITMENSQSSSPKLKLFQTLQKNLSSIGIVRRHPFNARIALILLILGVGIIFESVYIFHEAQTYLDYTQSICMFSGVILVTFNLLIMALYLTELFEIIDHCECISNTSM